MSQWLQRRQTKAIAPWCPCQHLAPACPRYLLVGWVVIPGLQELWQEVSEPNVLQLEKRLKCHWMIWMLSRGPEGNLNEVISYIMYEINVIRISKFISTKGPGQFYDCLEFMELLFCFPGWSGCLPSLGSVLSNRARWSWLWLVEMPCWEFSRVDLRNFNVKQRLVKYMWSDAEIRFFELSERK